MHICESSKLGWFTYVSQFSNLSLCPTQCTTWSSHQLIIHFLRLKTILWQNNSNKDIQTHHLTSPITKLFSWIQIRVVLTKTISGGEIGWCPSNLTTKTQCSDNCATLHSNNLLISIVIWSYDFVNKQCSHMWELHSHMWKLCCTYVRIIGSSSIHICEHISHMWILLVLHRKTLILVVWSKILK